VTSEEKEVSQKELERRKKRAALEEEEASDFDSREPMKKTTPRRPRDKGVGIRDVPEKKNGDIKLETSTPVTLGDISKESSP
jgi:hypothetical protein